MEKPRQLGVDVDLTASQERVLRVVERFPGVTIVELAKVVGCSHATATYHLNQLARRGLLTGRRDGREMRHFVAGLVSDPASWLDAMCRDERRVRLVVLLGSQGMPLTMNDMSRRLGIPFGSLKRTLVQFQAQNLVHMERRGFRYVVRPQPALLAYAANLRSFVDVGAITEGPLQEQQPAVALLRA